MEKILEINALPEGQSVRKFLFKPEELELKLFGAEFNEPVLFELTCIRTGFEITCMGWVTTKVRLQCVRCLEMFEYELKEAVNFMARLSLGAPEQVDLWDEDMVHVDRHKGVLNIAPRIHDAVLLGIPNYPLCSEDCKGLCPVCGANLNVTTCEHINSLGQNDKSPDPRWDKLAALLKKTNKSS